MLRSLQKLILLLALAIAANSLLVAMPVDRAFAATEKKKAKWQSPPQNGNAKNKQKKKKTVTTNKPVAKKSKSKKAEPNKKAILVKDTKKDAAKSTVTSAAKKDVPKKKVKVEKPEDNTLVVDQNFNEDEIALAEERSTSPLLIVFVTFVVCCVGGMLFLNQRKKQLEAAKMNFQEASASNHELAFSSSHERLDSAHPTHSGHETPTTRTLFERTDKLERSSNKSTTREPGFFGKISSKAASLIKSGKSKGGSDKKPKEISMQFDNEDMSAGSITTIGAVKSKGSKPTSKPPVAFNPDTTLDPIPANQGAEPCSFESYTEIQIAAQCWRSQKLSLDAKLRATFGIDTSALIQYEFYWKQKISNNVNLKKKYQELEPLYTAKYESAS